MPQNEHIELHQKRFGRRMDQEERESPPHHAALQAALSDSQSCLTPHSHLCPSAVVFPLCAIRRKREARSAHRRSEFAQKVHGLRAKLLNAKRYKEKAAMKKTILAHSERDNTRTDADSKDNQTALPAYLLDRQGQNRAKVLSNSIKQKRKEKAGKYQVPLPSVRPITEAEMFRVVKSPARPSGRRGSG